LLWGKERERKEELRKRFSQKRTIARLSPNLSGERKRKEVVEKPNLALSSKGRKEEKIMHGEKEKGGNVSVSVVVHRALKEKKRKRSLPDTHTPLKRREDGKRLPEGTLLPPSAEPS